MYNSDSNKSKDFNRVVSLPVVNIFMLLVNQITCCFFLHKRRVKMKILLPHHFFSNHDSEYILLTHIFWTSCGRKLYNILMETVCFIYRFILLLTITKLKTRSLVITFITNFLKL